MLGPRIGYARLVSPMDSPNQSQGMDYYSVIYYGHKAKQPLMCSSSDLGDGSEPHGLLGHHCGSDGSTGDGQWWEEVYPGWCRSWGTGRGAYRVPSLRPDLRLI